MMKATKKSRNSSFNAGIDYIVKEIADFTSMNIETIVKRLDDEKKLAWVK
jgi:uncharacterized protein YmfQ (DUF2313 family)